MVMVMMIIVMMMIMMMITTTKVISIKFLLVMPMLYQSGLENYGHWSHKMNLLFPLFLQETNKEDKWEFKCWSCDLKG